MRIAAKLAAWVGVGDPWERPRPTSWRPDVAWTLVVGVFVVLEVLLRHSMSGFEPPLWKVLTAGTLGALPLLLRRRYPIPVMFVSGLYLFTISTLVPETLVLLSLQFACFYAIYSAAAWAQDRQWLAIGAGAILLIIVVWIAWILALGQGLDVLMAQQSKYPGRGPFSPALAWGIFSILINLAYYVGAFTAGVMAWSQARATARVAAQAAQIAAHEAESRNQAVTEERLRIARELHDVVAHHVSVMGIQAAGARRVMASDPGAATLALTRVEESARQAVAEMRNLLGTLRSHDGSTAPTPRMDQIAEFASSDSVPVVSVRFIGDDVVVPEPVSLSLYRIVQESLNNVRRHSTARSVDVAVRRDPTFVEVEIVDDGRPRTGTSGSGLGQEGIRERVAALRGECEIGPRVGVGYRVRARIPLGEESS